MILSSFQAGRRCHQEAPPSARCPSASPQPTRAHRILAFLFHPSSHLRLSPAWRWLFPCLQSPGTFPLCAPFTNSYSFLRFLLGSSSLERLSLASLCWWVVTPITCLCTPPPMPPESRIPCRVPGPSMMLGPQQRLSRHSPNGRQQTPLGGGRLQPPDHAPASPAKSGCCLEAGPLP